jgi:DNA adenine methylase
LKPFLKWAGGKRQILSRILPIIESNLQENKTYYEPFVGGGSVFFALLRNQKTLRFVINDLNEELMNCYEVIRDNPHELIEELKIHEQKHYADENYYYFVRKQDQNAELYNGMTAVKKAARTIYLNQTCYNGLFRVNSRGFFNTPKGRYEKPRIVNEENINEVSSKLMSLEVEILKQSFEDAVKNASEGDFIYFDPPYDHSGKGFTSYVKSGFSFEDLKKLKNTCDELVFKGCHVLISNNGTDRVYQLFQDELAASKGIQYDIEEVEVRRLVGAKHSDTINEVLIHGYIKR